MNKKILWLAIVVFCLTLVTVSYAKQGPENGNGGPMNGTSTQAQNRVMASTSTSTQNKIRTMSEEHRSEMSKFVNGLLGSSERVGGIGKQVSALAKAQASFSGKVADSIKTVESRNGFKTFLIGSDYKNLGAIRSDIVLTANRLDQLEKELEKVASSTEKADIQKQIDDMKAYQTKLEAFVKANESRFSLFGWAVRLFNR